MEKLEQAMSTQDYEEAALCIGHFRDLQARLLQEADPQQEKVGSRDILLNGLTGNEWGVLRN